jgi:hypothetical protein
MLAADHAAARFASRGSDPQRLRRPAATPGSGSGRRRTSSSNDLGSSWKEREAALEDLCEVRRAGLTAFAKHDLLDAHALPRCGGKPALKACLAALMWTSRERARLQQAKHESSVTSQTRGGAAGDASEEDEEDEAGAALRFEWPPVGAAAGRLSAVRGRPGSFAAAAPAALVAGELGAAAPSGEGLSSAGEAAALAGLAVLATVQLLLRVAASDLLPLHVAAAERDLGRIQAEVGLYSGFLHRAPGCVGASSSRAAFAPASGPSVQCVDTARWWIEDARGLEHLEASLGSFGPGSTCAALDAAGAWARRTLHAHWPEFMPP